MLTPEIDNPGNQAQKDEVLSLCSAVNGRSYYAEVRGDSAPSPRFSIEGSNLAVEIHGHTERILLQIPDAIRVFEADISYSFFGSFDTGNSKAVSVSGGFHNRMTLIMDEDGTHLYSVLEVLVDRARGGISHGKPDPDYNRTATAGALEDAQKDARRLLEIRVDSLMPEAIGLAIVSQSDRKSAYTSYNVVVSERDCPAREAASS